MKTVTATPAEHDRAQRAIAYVHEHVCRPTDPPRVPETGPCIMCPSPLGVLLALAHLDEKPRDAQQARVILHDFVCSSGSQCGDGGDHARRTQSKRVAALRRFHAREGRLA